jgi:hypothetical protein
MLAAAGCLLLLLKIRTNRNENRIAFCFVFPHFDRFGAFVLSRECRDA